MIIVPAIISKTFQLIAVIRLESGNMPAARKIAAAESA